MVNLIGLLIKKRLENGLYVKWCG